GCEVAMKRLRNEDGQVLVITVICMAMLVAALGFAIDLGVLFRARRNAQIAADSAAMAGATAYFYGVDPTSAAQNAAHAVDPAITSDKIIVTAQPTLAGVTCKTCVEVQLYKPTPTMFMSTFSKMRGGSSFSPINVAAKSIGGAPGT